MFEAENDEALVQHHASFDNVNHEDTLENGPSPSSLASAIEMFEDRIRKLEESLSQKQEGLVASVVQNVVKHIQEHPSIASNASEKQHETPESLLPKIAPQNSQETPEYKYTEVTFLRPGERTTKVAKPPTSVSPNTPDVGSLQYEITFYKGNTADSQPKTKVVIFGQGLKSLLWAGIQGFVEHCGNSKAWKTRVPVVLWPKYDPILHSWEQLHNLCKGEPASGVDKNDQRHLGHLLQDIKELMHQEVQNMESLVSSKLVEYENVDYLFTPGQYMVAFPVFGLPQLFQIDNRSYAGDLFIVYAWAYDWDGSKLSRMLYKHAMASFLNHKKVTELPFYPVEFYSDKGLISLRREIKERGIRFADYCKKGKQYYAYEGQTITYDGDGSDFLSIANPRVPSDSSFLPHAQRPLKPNSAFNPNYMSLDTQDEIIIDPGYCLKWGFSSLINGFLFPWRNAKTRECAICSTRKREQWTKAFPDITLSQETQERENFDDVDDHLLLLPARVLGFGLGSKKWAQFSVDGIKDIEPASQAIKDQLVLPDKGIKLDDLEEVISNHVKDSNQGESRDLKDVIAGKGNGLVFLFHGPTGVGKTLTAEVLAKSSGLPLYKVGISDIGSQPEQAEANLRRLFDTASAWKAILLIDEADVFLDSRGTIGEAEMDKNAMVAVLLREIEYFPGVLIMTTNRVTSFDVAMLSRIHWPINFGNMKIKHEIEIWKKWIDRWKTHNQKVSRTDRELNNGISESLHFLKELGRQKEDTPASLSGREIRNIFVAAYTKADGGIVNWDDIEDLRENILAFRSEMRYTRDKTEARLLV